jgi:hypothetical protein
METGDFGDRLTQAMDAAKPHPCEHSRVLLIGKCHEVLAGRWFCDQCGLEFIPGDVVALVAPKPKEG